MGSKSLEELLIKTLVESSAQYPADGTARCGLQLSVRRAYSAHRGQLPCRSAASRYDLPFTQSPEDYYNNPLTGTYFRMIRFLCIPVSLLLLPVFLLLSAYYPEITCLAAAHTRQRSVTLPPFFLCAGGGFLLDLFKVFSGTQLQPRLRCSVHCRRTINLVTLLSVLTGPPRKSSSMLPSPCWRICPSPVSNLLMLCGSTVFSLVVTTGLWGLPGFLIGLTLVTVSILTTPTFAGFSYFWPLFPFNGPALRSLLFPPPTYKGTAK